jgi:hypothetical protein
MTVSSYSPFLSLKKQDNTIGNFDIFIALALYFLKVSSNVLEDSFLIKLIQNPKYNIVDLGISKTVFPFFNASAILSIL